MSKFQARIYSFSFRYNAHDMNDYSDQAWTIELAREHYAIEHWSAGYFDIDRAGDVVVCLPGNEPLALGQIADQALAGADSALRLPLLLRFPQILRHRADRLRQVFDDALRSRSLDGGFTLLYPVKVNQQRSVVETLVRDAACGLEVGSKPELMIALAVAAEGSTLVCNGYKDRTFIRLALNGRRLGLDVILIVEQPGEIELIAGEAEALGIEPVLGLRARLASLGAGNWQNTGGERAKFGLSPSQIIAAVERLRAAGRVEWLKLLHFHMGSQIANLRDIRNGVTEAGRLLVELRGMGVPIDMLDIGGGLGVDYEGARSRSPCSMNYSLEQYAECIVGTLAALCGEAGQSLPGLLSESGRALTAHHAVLVTGVVDIEIMPDGAAGENEIDNRHELLESMQALLQDERTLPVEELWLEMTTLFEQAQQVFLAGDLSLAGRARAECLYYRVLGRLEPMLDPRLRRHRELQAQLRRKLADKYFINLSIFQSLPDIWGLDQVFPIMPLARLHESPSRHAVLEDLTCDSDGRIDRFVELGDIEPTLRVPAPAPGEAIRFGIFLSGAYQETLGDIHNLFGDTDSVDVLLDAGRPVFRRARRGDTAGQVIGQVGYDPDALIERYRQRIDGCCVPADTAGELLRDYRDGMQACTYLQGDA